MGQYAIDRGKTLEALNRLLHQAESVAKTAKETENWEELVRKEAYITGVKDSIEIVKGIS